MERRRANMKRARSNKFAIKGGTKLNAVETKTRSRLWSKSTGTNVVVDPTQESVNN
ncbi:hypothetical protein AXF42_Ash009028 [Apostasia shenzhenica]|uniref:Uncharacterized protein n=1 Tax=Apostasia shenzhenica TaxID=1088818 RepID=A0A2I0AD97_9ASPA|nr:hypothetical protein AXF42_Ash009028 [Apostasia shenzhenica]